MSSLIVGPVYSPLSTRPLLSPNPARSFFTYVWPLYIFKHVMLLSFSFCILFFPSLVKESRHVVKSVLFDHQNSNVTIPRSFYEVRSLHTHWWSNSNTLLMLTCVRFCWQVYPHQALLLLVSGALSFRILNGALCPALPVINTFKVILWTFGELHRQC